MGLEPTVERADPVGNPDYFIFHDPTDTEMTPLKISILCVMTTSNVFMLLGNTASIYIIIRSPSLRQHTYYWLVLNLAVLDLVNSMFVVPINIVWEFYGYWPFSHLLCDLEIFCDLGFSTVAAYSTVLLSLDKYLYITKPFFYHRYVGPRSTLASILLTWVLWMTYAAASVFGELARSTKEYKYAFPLDKCNFVLRHAFAITSFILVFFIPLLILVFTSSRILFVARTHIRKINTNQRVSDAVSISPDVSNHRDGRKAPQAVSSPATTTSTSHTNTLASVHSGFSPSKKTSASMPNISGYVHSVSASAQNTSRSALHTSASVPNIFAAVPGTENSSTSTHNNFTASKCTSISEHDTSASAPHTSVSVHDTSTSGENTLTSVLSLPAEDNCTSAQDTATKVNVGVDRERSGPTRRYLDIFTGTVFPLLLPTSATGTDSRSSPHGANRGPPRKARQQPAGGKRHTPNSFRALGTVTLVVLAYIIMFAPYWIASVINLGCVCIQPLVFEDYLATFYYMHSLVNPYIYMATDRRYKKAIRHLWAKSPCRRRHRQRNNVAPNIYVSSSNT